MAITFAQLAAATNSTVNATSYSGNTGSPGSNELLIAFVIASDTVATGSFSDGGIPWTKLYSFTINGGTDTVYVFYRIVEFAFSVDPVFDCTGDEATGCSIYVLRVAGYENKLAPFVRQIKHNSGSSNTPNVVLNSAILSTSGSIGAAYDKISTADQWSPPSGWTEHFETFYIDPTTSQQVSSRASGETSATITWANISSVDWWAIVIELAVEGSVPFFQVEEPKPAKVIKFKRDVADPTISPLILTAAATTPKVIAENPKGLLKRKFKPSEERSNLLYFDNNTYAARTHRVPDKIKRKRVLRSEDVTNSLILSAVAGVPPVQQEEIKFKPRKKFIAGPEGNGFLLGIAAEVVPGPITLQVWPKKRFAITWDEPQVGISIFEIAANVPVVHAEVVLPKRWIRKRSSEELESLALSQSVVFYPAVHVEFGRLTRKRVAVNSIEPPSLPVTLLAFTDPDLSDYFRRYLWDVEVA